MRIAPSRVRELCTERGLTKASSRTDAAQRAVASNLERRLTAPSLALLPWLAEALERRGADPR